MSKKRSRSEIDTEFTSDLVYAMTSKEAQKIAHLIKNCQISTSITVHDFLQSLQSGTIYTAVKTEQLEKKQGKLLVVPKLPSGNHAVIFANDEEMEEGARIDLTKIGHMSVKMVTTADTSIKLDSNILSIESDAIIENLEDLTALQHASIRILSEYEVPNSMLQLFAFLSKGASCKFGPNSLIRFLSIDDEKGNLDTFVHGIENATYLQELLCKNANVNVELPKSLCELHCGTIDENQVFALSHLRVLEANQIVTRNNLLTLNDTIERIECDLTNKYVQLGAKTNQVVSKGKMPKMIDVSKCSSKEIHVHVSDKSDSSAVPIIMGAEKYDAEFCDHNLVVLNRK